MADKLNLHCDSCETCTTKDGGKRYVHCYKCQKCVKPSWKHCSRCQKCHLADSIEQCTNSLHSRNAKGATGHPNSSKKQRRSFKTRQDNKQQIELSNFQSCNESFQTQEQLQSHVHDVQQEHEGEIMCNLCGRVFANLQGLQRHEVFHTGEKRTCAAFVTRDFQPWSLKVHLKSMHPEGNSSGSVEEHECQQPDCDAKFKLKSNLMRHMRKQHKIFMRTGN